jgi:branched-chain amino acid transport system permease protein
MDWIEFLEDLWDDIKDRGYYIIAFTLLVLVPFILVVPGFAPIPILSDIYAIGRNANLFDANTYVLSVLSLCAIWAIFAASWDLLSGYTGQVSFGHAIFWGIAAYASFWLATGFNVGFTLIKADTHLFGPPIDALLIDILNSGISFLNDILKFIFTERFILNFGKLGHINLSVLAALILAALVASIIALVIGIIALRVKGYYLALVTLILPLIVAEIVVIYTDLFGPTFGIPNVPSIIEEGDFATKEIFAFNFYIVTIIIFIISIGLMMLIAFSRIGLAFQSIREDEDAAESLGINIRNYKILAFCLSAFFAGLAGGLYSQWLDFSGKSLFGSHFSFSVIIMVVIGGVGSITGGAVGAFLLTILVKLFLDDVFEGIYGLDILVYGFILVLTLRYMRFGLVRAAKEQKRACIFGILFAFSWVIITSSDLFEILTSGGDILEFIVLVIMLILTLPFIPVFIGSEIVGMFLLEGLLGMELGSALIKAKFLIYASVGIPFAYYLPKIFKAVRLRYWGTWPSAGRYEPD